jgi:hypothetical protein
VQASSASAISIASESIVSLSSGRPVTMCFNAVQILHHHEGPAVVHAEIMNSADVGMVQGRRGAGFTAKALKGLRSGRTMARNRASNDAAVSIVPPIIRTAGFPQYGWKAGISDGALAVVCEFFATYGLHPPFVHLAACSAVSSF